MQSLSGPCADISLDIALRQKIYRQYYRRRQMAPRWRDSGRRIRTMYDRHCGPGFAWAFGMRPENFGFDPGAFWGGRGKSRGGPFGGGRMFDQGHLKFVILRLLDEKPRHGYEIIKEIEERFGGMYSPSPGTVYPTLTMLEDLGYARVLPEEGGKKIYEITEEGRKHLGEQQPCNRELLP